MLRFVRFRSWCLSSYFPRLVTSWFVKRTPSSQTYPEFAAYRERLFFVPENGISRSLLAGAPRNSRREEKPELILVGGLVPYKACGLALWAAVPLLQRDRARFTTVATARKIPKV
jgi:hypothetical protein